MNASSYQVVRPNLFCLKLNKGAEGCQAYSRLKCSPLLTMAGLYITEDAVGDCHYCTLRMSPLSMCRVRDLNF